MRDAAASQAAGRAQVAASQLAGTLALIAAEVEGHRDAAVLFAAARQQQALIAERLDALAAQLQPQSAEVE